MTSDTYTLHVIDGYIETLFLAVYPDKILVLDSGCRNDVPKVVSYVSNELEMPMSSVKLVVASHTHPDHAGGAPAFRRRYSIPVAAPENINRWYRGTGGFIQHKIDTMLGYFVAYANRSPFGNILYRRKLAFDCPLSEGGRLPFFDDWRVIETPGHTSHDIVLYNDENATLYAADVMLKVNGRYLPPFPVPFPDRMSRSLDKLSELKVDTLLLAHGGLQSVSDFGGIINELKINMNRSINPGFRRLLYLQQFSPEIEKAEKTGGAEASLAGFIRSFL